MILGLSVMILQSEYLIRAWISFLFSKPG